MSDGMSQAQNFLALKIIMLSCPKHTYTYLRYVFHCPSQISTCPILGVNVDFPFALENRLMEVY